jgi:predicted nucleotidyltransferase
MGAFIEAARELGDEESEEILQEHRALLERCREVGMEEAFGERAGSEEGESEQSLVQALQAFVTAETWDEAEQIVEAHPDLLRDEVDKAIALLVDSALEEGEDATAIILQEHQRILQRCRQLGIGEAFAQEMGENDSGNGEK